VTRFRDFVLWLWTDWGRPSFLTRLGLPRILIDPILYLAYPSLLYFIMYRFLSAKDRPALIEFLRNPFVLAAYAVFFIVHVLGHFLQQKYGRPGVNPSDQFRSLRQNLGDPFVRIYLLTIATFILCLLIGGLQLQSQFMHH